MSKSHNMDTLAIPAVNGVKIHGPLCQGFVALDDSLMERGEQGIHLIVSIG